MEAPGNGLLLEVSIVERFAKLLGSCSRLAKDVRSSIVEKRGRFLS